jgi:hypothetical protein
MRCRGLNWQLDRPGSDAAVGRPLAAEAPNETSHVQARSVSHRSSGAVWDICTGALGDIGPFKNPIFLGPQN